MTNHSTTIALWDDKRLADEARMYKSTMPGAKNLTDEQVAAQFHIGRAMALNPWNGEIWYIPGVGISTGIKGLRKQAHAQIKDGNFWTQFREIADAAEKKRLLIPESALAFEARLFDSETLRTYVESIKALRGAEIPIADVMEMVGKQPYTAGIGVFIPGEATKMKPVQCAMKRAEAAAIKSRFDVNLLVDVETEDSAPASPGAYIEGSYTSAPAGERVDTATGEIAGQAGTTNGHAKRDAAQDTKDLFGGTKPADTAERSSIQRPYPAERVREALRATAGSAPAMPTPEYKSATMASLSGLVNGSDSSRRAIMKYLFGVESGNDLTNGQCRALKGWIAAKQNKAGEWVPLQYSIQEAQAILTAFAIESGQQELPIAVTTGGAGTGDPVLDYWDNQPGKPQAGR